MFKKIILPAVLSLFLFHSCSQEKGYQCETTGNVDCEPVADKTPPSPALSDLRTKAVGLWRLYSSYSLDASRNRDTTYLAYKMKNIPELCLSGDGKLVDNNGLTGKNCTYCYSIVPAATSQDSFDITLGDFGPQGCDPVFRQSRIELDGDTLYVGTWTRSYLYIRNKFVRK